MKTDRNPLVVKVNMGAGHGGSSGRYDALRETAFTYAYVLWQMGVPRGTS
jgi:oligopeptidase B